MQYFYLWCVFLLSVILSVPLVAFLEKRKRPPRPVADHSFGGDEPMEDDGLGDDAGGEMVDEAEPLEPAGEAGFGGGEDDFPAFDDEIS